MGPVGPFSPGERAAIKSQYRHVTYIINDEVDRWAAEFLCKRLEQTQPLAFLNQPIRGTCILPSAKNGKLLAVAARSPSSYRT